MRHKLILIIVVHLFAIRNVRCYKLWFKILLYVIKLIKIHSVWYIFASLAAGSVSCKQIGTHPLHRSCNYDFLRTRVW